MIRVPQWGRVWKGAPMAWCRSFISKCEFDLVRKWAAVHYVHFTSYPEWTAIGFLIRESVMTVKGLSKEPLDETWSWRAIDQRQWLKVGRKQVLHSALDQTPLERNSWQGTF
jgi:hypothetical protein